MSNPILMQPPGLIPGPGPQVQIDTAAMSVQDTPQNAPPGSYNRLSALADAADLCLRTDLDPDVLQAAINLQTQRSPSPTSAAVRNPQRQQSTASEVQFQHYKPTVAANPQRRNKARATRPPTWRLLFPPPKPTNAIPVIDLTSSPAHKKRKADVFEEAEDPEDIEGLENVGAIPGTKKSMMHFFDAHIGSKK